MSLCWIHIWTNMSNKQTHIYMACSQQVSEPLAASEKEGRRTVTQRENVSAQYGKQSSHHSQICSSKERWVWCMLDVLLWDVSVFHTITSPCRLQESMNFLTEMRAHRARQHLCTYYHLVFVMFIQLPESWVKTRLSAFCKETEEDTFSHWTEPSRVVLDLFVQMKSNEQLESDSSERAQCQCFSGFS